MNPADPNIQRVELVANALGDLRAELVLVGGCAASLLINAPTAPPPRVTYDVDLIAEVTALHNYHALEEQFLLLGFRRDMSPDAPICRWRLGEVAVDLMPTDGAVLGFSNRWYPLAAASATRLALPSGNEINLISTPAFLATKFEAFQNRGRGDLLMSHDLEDIINVVEGIWQSRRKLKPANRYCMPILRRNLPNSWRCRISGMCCLALCSMMAFIHGAWMQS